MNKMLLFGDPEKKYAPRRHEGPPILEEIKTWASTSAATSIGINK